MAMAGYSNDYSNSCRLCLSKEGRQFAIFGPATDEVGPLSNRIFSCLSIDISLYDDLPKQICHRCECQINLWHYFKVECEVSQRKLSAWFGTNPSSSSEKETPVEECTIFQECINIKLEPEDVDMHINSEHEDAGYMQTKEADSSLGNLVGLDQDITSNESSSLNLVISGTSSVDPFVHEDIRVNDKQFELVQISHSSDVTSDSGAQLKNNGTCVNDKAWSEVENPQDNLIEKFTSAVERFVNVKSEPKESKTVSECSLQQKPLSSKSTSSIRSSRSLSPSNHIPSSTSTAVSHQKRIRSLSLESKHKKPRLSGNTAEHFKVPNNYPELPKIINDVYDETLTTCKLCVKQFSNIQNLWRHIKAIHAQSNPFRCGVCRKDFCERRELIAHRLGTINKYCRLGKKPEVNMSSFITINPKIKAGTRGKYGCSECKLKFSKLTAAQAHDRIHSGEKPFTCFICNEREFRLRKTAMKHVTVCKGKHELKPQIPQKDHKLVSTAVVSVPKLLLHNIVAKSLKKRCPKCGKVFQNGIGLSNHLRTSCSKKCISCLKFIPSETFQKHFRQCLKATHSSSAPPDIHSGNCIQSSNKNEDSTAVKTRRKEDSCVSEGSKAFRRKLKQFDMTLQEMWKKQLNENGKLLSLTCVFCGRTSTNRRSLHKHISKHSRKRAPGQFPGFMRPKLKCDKCSKLFNSASTLEYHKLTHNRIKCEKCELTFPASMERTHLCTTKVKTEPVQLPENDPTAPPKQRVIQYTCLLCKKKFHTRKMLYQHKKMHIKVKIFKCKMCNNSYSDAGALKIHREEDHKDKSGVVVEDNRVELIQNESAEGQSSVHKSPELVGEKSLNCSFCHKGYSSEGSLDRHMKLHVNSSKIFAIQKPSDPGIFYCNTCDKAFTSFASFNRHKGWHSRVEASPKTEDANFDSSLSFSCPLCFKQFASQKNVRIHMHCHKNPKLQSPKETKKENVSHLETTLKCEIPTVTCTDSSAFSSHMDTHPEKPSDALINPAENCLKQETFHCKLCNKEYKNKKSLNYHMMGHSGEKPYKCKSCSNQYSNPKALSKHEKERHAVILHPFSCNRCKTSFLLREDLLGHQEKCPH